MLKLIFNRVDPWSMDHEPMLYGSYVFNYEGLGYADLGLPVVFSGPDTVRPASRNEAPIGYVAGFKGEAAIINVRF